MPSSWAIGIKVSAYCPAKGYFVTLFEDITERKKAEDALKQSKNSEFGRRKELEAIMETVPATIWITHDSQCLNMVGNKATYELLRMLPNTNVSESAPEEQRPTNFLAYNSQGQPIPLEDLPMQVTARTGIPVFNSEFEFRFVDGRSVWVYGNVTPLRDANGNLQGAVGAYIDITQIKQMQTKLEEYAKHMEKLVEERTKQLKDSERLATIGATAGMVGHDIRNPLQAIASDVFLVKSELTSMSEGEEKENINESLEGIEKNIDYINKIVQDLQDYVRPLTLSEKETDLEKLFSEVLVKKAIPSNIEFSFHVDQKARKMVADSALLKRVLANLVNNAVQAMPNGGKLDLNAFVENSDTIITVKDNGVGIPEEVRPKLFTPLFTTKSKGQGFGLAVVKRMTEALGGTVTFESQEGKGTTFIIRLSSLKR